MKEILLTSSVLILALAFLRQILGKHVTKKFQYALWGLVLLRLLIPVQFGSLSFSVTSLAQDSEPIAVIEHQLSQPMVDQDYEHIYQRFEQQYENQGYIVTNPEVVTQITQETVEFMDLPTWGEILTFFWFAGIAAMAVWFILVNLRFRRSARKNAVRLDAESPIPVYVSRGVASPCLTGLLRPVIYLTPACAEDERLRRHVLTHELTHYRHGDHIWSVLRSLCLCIYWFDPLVWLAAILSRRDCELACDEGTLKQLGENERLGYGRSLVDVVAGDLSPKHLMEAATAMNESKRQITERVNRIVKKPKVYVLSAICLLLAAALIAGCAFAGKVTKPEPKKDEYLLLETVTQIHAYDGTPDRRSWEQRSYDEKGHLTRIAKSGEEESITVSAVECDKDGNVTLIENRLHGDISEAITTWSKLTYNSDGYLLSDREYVGSGLQTDQVQGKEYTYDQNGNELTCKHTVGDFVWQSTKTYDKRGNLATRSIVNGDYADRTEYTYDAQDRLTQAVTYVHGEKDRVEEYAYSDDGLTTTMLAYDGSTAALGKTVTTKSADGRSAEVVITLPDGTEEQRSTYVYDEAGNCVFEQVFKQGRLYMTIVSRYMKPGEQAEYMLTYLPGDEVMDTQLYPFPGTTWGMTPDQVIKALGLKEGEYEVYPAKEGESNYAILCPQMKVYGAVADVGFIFGNSNGVNRLYTVRAGLPSTTDFNALKAEMTTRYGAAEPGNVLKWSSDVTQYDLFSEDDKAFADLMANNSSYKQPATSILLSINNRLYATTYQGEVTNYSITFLGTCIHFMEDEVFPNRSKDTDSTEPAEPQPLPEDYSENDLYSIADGINLKWVDGAGNEERFPARIPALYPFSNDAIAVNAHIAEKYGAMIDENITAAATGCSAYPVSIDFEAHLNGNVLSLVITTDTGNDYIEYEVFNFYLEPGKYALTMDDAAMAKYFLDMSYPEFLYAATQFSVDEFDRYYASPDREMEDNQVVEDFKQQYLDDHGMPLGHNPLDLRSYDLYLSDGGLLVLKYNRISMAGADYYPTISPFTPGPTDKAESYHWLFNIHADGAYATAHNMIFCDAFLADPEEFVEYLSLESDDIIARVAVGIGFDCHPNQAEPIREALASLPDSNFKTLTLEKLDEYWPET